MRRILAAPLIGFLAVLIVPVVIAQLSEPETRAFEAVDLEEVDFQEIEFRNAEQNLSLAGILLTPDGQGPFPAAAMIQGSGASRRDNGWYLTLAQYLQDHGVMILLPDKRGSGSSGGDWRTASFEDLATDTVAATRYLRTRDDVVASQVGIIGLSQGGHIAPIVGNRVGDLSFLVNVVGGAVPMHELLRYEEKHNLREMGILPGLSDLLAYPSAWSITSTRNKAFWDGVGNFDPIPHWRSLGVKSFALYGENDTNVPSQKSAELLRSLANPNITVKIYEGSGHALESPEGAGNSIFRNDAMTDILDFIRASR